MKLKDRLIKLGYTNPELRANLTPILDALTSKNANIKLPDSLIKYVTKGKDLEQMRMGYEYKRMLHGVHLKIIKYAEGGYSIVSRDKRVGFHVGDKFGNEEGRGDGSDTFVYPFNKKLDDPKTNGEVEASFRKEVLRVLTEKLDYETLKPLPATYYWDSLSNSKELKDYNVTDRDILNAVAEIEAEIQDYDTSQLESYINKARRNIFDAEDLFWEDPTNSINVAIYLKTALGIRVAQRYLDLRRRG